MRTLEQQYAAAVYEKVKAYEENHPDENDKNRQRYGAIAQKLPVLIRTAGLAQALAFVEAKATGGNREPYEALLEHLACVLGYPNKDELLRDSRQVPISEYIDLTHRALLTLTWFKRFSQSVLKVDPATVEEG